MLPDAVQGHTEKGGTFLARWVRVVPADGVPCLALRWEIANTATSVTSVTSAPGLGAGALLPDIPFAARSARAWAAWPS